VATKTKPRVTVRVAPDRLRAWMSAPAGEDLSGLTPGEVTVALEEAKVAVDDPVVARIQAFLEQIQQGEHPADFLAAEGRPAVEGDDAHFVWNESFAGEAAGDEQDADGSVDYRTRNMIRTVERDAVLGALHPARPGTPGVDVHGNTLQPKRRLREITLTDGVRLADDGQTVIASRPGRAVLERFRLGVRDVLQIDGDVDFDCGNIDATSDVEIRGTVRDLFEVRSRKSVTIGGAVEAAEVHAAGDITVRGGVLARGKGVVEAGGVVYARFCDEATLRAAGDIHIFKEAINSRLCTTGRVLADRGAVIGGELYAREGVEVHTLGSDGCVLTRVLVGTHPSVFRRVQELEEELRKRQESVDKIRQTVQPLMANLKRLTVEQREKATELLFNADELEAEIVAARKRQEALVADSRPANPPAVKVNGRICQNVAMVFGTREAHFHQDLKGPVVIELRKMDNVTEVVTVNQLSGSVSRLNSAPCDLSQFEEDPQLPQKPPPEDSVDDATPPEA